MESFQDILQAFFQRKDSIYFVLLAAGAVALVAGEAAGRFVRAFRRRSPLLPEDDVRLQFLWSLIPLLVLACLASVSTDGSHVRKKPLAFRTPPAALR